MQHSPAPIDQGAVQRIFNGFGVAMNAIATGNQIGPVHLLFQSGGER